MAAIFSRGRWVSKRSNGYLGDMPTFLCTGCNWRHANFFVHWSTLCSLHGAMMGDGENMWFSADGSAVPGGIYADAEIRVPLHAMTCPLTCDEFKVPKKIYIIAVEPRARALKSIRSLRFQYCIKIISYIVWVPWNSKQNILPIHWKM